MLNSLLTALALLLAVIGVGLNAAAYHRTVAPPASGAAATVLVTTATEHDAALPLGLYEYDTPQTIDRTFTYTNWGVPIKFRSRFTRLGDRRLLQLTAERTYIPFIPPLTTIDFSFLEVGFNATSYAYDLPWRYSGNLNRWPCTARIGDAVHHMVMQTTTGSFQLRPRSTSISSSVWTLWGAGVTNSAFYANTTFELPSGFFSWVVKTPTEHTILV